MGSWTVDAPQRITIDGPVDRLDVHLISGRVNVVATDGPARVEIARIGNAPVLVEERDGMLTVRLRRPPHWPGAMWWFGLLGRRYKIDVSIAVPASVATDLRMVSGSVVVAGLRHSTRVEVTSGRVTLMGLGGRTDAHLVSGPVEALGVAGDLTLETVSGELVLADSPAERVSAKTVSGAITCDLDNPRKSEIRLSTTSGSVTVRVREDSDLSVDLHTRSGRITSAFPGVPTADRHGGRRDSQGVIGAGTGRLWADTTSGSIALLARAVERDA
jgi:hypothetical protein